MKYENVEFERNFQLNPNVRSPNEANTSASSSARSQQQAEKTHDDIQVSFFLLLFRYCVCKIYIFNHKTDS